MRLQTLAQKPISTYQRYISKDYNGMRGSQCAFHPSCSAYAKEELADKGVEGLKETFYRLRRCTAGTSSERLTAFLLHAAHCPDQKTSDFFTFEDSKVLPHWRRFRKQLAKNQKLIQAGNGQSGAQGISDAMGDFFRHVHMSIEGELKPGVSPRFRLLKKRPTQPVARVDRGTLGNRLRSTAGLAMGLGGAGLGALGAGLGAAFIGLREGFAAGSGRLPLFRKKVEDRYGVGSLSLSEPFLKRMDNFAQRLDFLPGRVMESAIGGIVGGAIGIAAGLTGGGIFGAQTGWDMGRLLGENWSDQRLSKHFEGRGEIRAQADSEPKESTAPQLNGEQAQLFQKLLSQVPSTLATQPPETKLKKPWSVVGLMDGTDPRLERHELAKIGHFANRAPIGLSSALHLRRGPGKLKKVAPLLLAGAAPLALAISPALGLAAGVGLWAMLEHSLGEQEKRQEELLKGSGAVWSGSRLFDNATVATSTPDPAPLKETELTELFKSKLPKDSEKSLLLLSGHGQGRSSIAGYRTESIAKALQSSGREVRLGILEGCQTATLEGLAPLCKQMRYAIASQLDMDGAGLPWHHLLGNLPKLGQTPEDFAAATVELAGGLPTVPSISLIDLKELTALKDAVEELSLSLLRTGELHSVREAVKVSIHKTPSGFARITEAKRVDLESFLTCLEKSAPASSADLVRKTREALSRVVKWSPFCRHLE